MYITEIIAHNFQSHKHTVVHLDKGLNVFVGENDQGKTALAKRAIQWCLFNEPQGNDFVRFKENGKTDKNGEPEREELCYVTVKFSNGIEVTRKREKNKNYYQLIDENGEIFNFENFGNQVPEEIQKAIGISKLKVDDDIQLNLNIIGAKDRSLIYENGNYKAKVIGSFAGTNIIDVAIRSIQADMKNIALHIKQLEKEVQGIDEEIAQMGDMQAKEKIVKEIDNLYFSLQENNYLREELIRLARNIEMRKEAIINDKQILEKVKDIDQKEQLLVEFENIITKARELMSLRNNLMLIRNRINERKLVISEARKIIERYKNADKEEIELAKKELELNSIQNQINNIHNKRMTLYTIHQRIQTKQQIIKTAKDIIEKYKDIDEQEQKVLNIEQQLSDISEEVKRITDTKNQLTRLNTEIQKKLDIRIKGQAYIKQKEKEIAQLIESCVQNIIKLGKCPTCMSDLDASHVDRIKQELINL